MNESADQTETESAPGNVMDQIEDFIGELVSGEKPGLLAGVVIGILVCAAVFLGLLYHCVRRSGPPKDLEFDFNMYEDSDDDQDGNRRSKVVVRPKTGAEDRRSGVVSFLEAFGKSKRKNSVTN